MDRFIQGLARLAVLTILALIAGAGIAEGQTYTCMKAGEVDEATLLRDYISELVTAPASNTRLWNKRIRYQLPVKSDSDVTIDAKKGTCNKAGDAYHESLYGADPPIDRTLVVVGVKNSNYVVIDPVERGGEFQVFVIFDTHWTEVASFGG